MRTYNAREIWKIEKAGLLEMSLLWKPTSMVEPPLPIRAYSGKFPGGLILMDRGDKCVMRRYVVPRDPRTAAQLRKRDHMRRCPELWLALSAGQREAWNAWTAQYCVVPGSGKLQSGRNMFTGAVMTTGMMGLPAPTSAPAGPPPKPVISVTQETAPGADSFAFRVRHGVKNPAGMRLLFEITDAMPSLRRKPRDNELRLLSADDTKSFVPLEADGGLYVLEDARFSVEPGRRYGVRVAIVTEQGIRSKPLFTDFIKADVPQQAARDATGVLQPTGDGDESLRTQRLLAASKARWSIPDAGRIHTDTNQGSESPAGRQPDRTKPIDPLELYKHAAKLVAAEMRRQRRE